MLTTKNFKATGDIRRDYYAHCEIVENQFLGRNIVREIHRRIVDSKKEVRYHIATDSGDAQESCCLTLNRNAEHFGTYRDEILNGIVHIVYRRDLTEEEESKLDCAVEDSDSDDELDNESDSDENEDYRERVARRMALIEQRRQARQKRRSNDDGSSRRIIMPHQMVAIEKESWEKINTEIIVSNPENRLEFVDVYCLAKALESNTFRLKTLKLVGCGLSCQSVAQISETLSKYCRHTVRFFGIEMNPFSDISHEDEQEKEDDIAKHPKEYVDSFQAQQIGSAFENETGDGCIPLASFESAIKSFMNTGIRHLSLRSCGIGDNGASIVADVLKTDSNIVSITLFGNNIGDTGAHYIANALRTNRRLQSLDLGLNSDLTDNASSHFADVFREIELQSLEEFIQVRNDVYLSEYGQDKVLSPESIPEHPFTGKDKVAKGRTKTKGEPQKVEPLEEWESQCRMIGSPQAGRSSSKKGSKRQEQEENPEDPDPIRYIVPGNTTLRHIGLSCNRNLTDTSVRSFLTEGTNLESLERLNFSRTQVSPDILAELAAARMNHMLQSQDHDRQEEA